MSTTWTREYDFNGCVNYISYAEYTSVRITGSCSFVDYANTPSIPHRDQLVETRIAAEQRGGKIRPGIRPVEDPEARKWLKVHVQRKDGESLCGKAMEVMVSEKEWGMLAKRRRCQLCQRILDR